VEGHNILGVNVARLGELTLSGPHQIQSNGSLAADSTLRAGIRVSRGSLTLNNGVQVSNNIGPGIRADFNTGTAFGNVTVTNNGEEGVRAGRQSAGDFIAPLTFAGNGEASISCDSTSLIFGDLSGVAGINCVRIERAMGRPRPGRVRS
jgi:hypothetical protein